MLRIHTKDGQTVAVDLSDEAQAREWLRRLAHREYQASITGLTLVETHTTRAVCQECGARCSSSLGIQYSISRPQDFRKIEVVAEHIAAGGKVRGGERAVLFCDDVRLSVMAHAEQPAVRITLAKVGRRKFDPNARGVLDPDGK